MTTRAERTIEVDGPIEDVWAFIADSGKRANAISVVERFERLDEDGERVRWHIRLPIPLLSTTVAVDTEEIDHEPPNYVRFIGESSVLKVVGEHTLEGLDGRTRLTSRFTVDGRLPGVESFFKRNLDREFDNLESALIRALDT